MRSITKRFGDVVANDDINIDIAPGEIHALVGQNGAGKTTLMRILFGSIQADSGDILLNDRKVSLKSPRDAIANGIGMVHQHFLLVPNFTVAQNVVLGSVDSYLSRFERGRIEREVREVSRQFGLHLEPRTVVAELSVDLQQRVEILKLLYRNATTLILDEPTSALGPREIEAVFQVLRQLRESGRSVVIITHKMAEVVDLADRVTVLRDGRIVAQADRGDFDEHRLALAMVGKELAPPALGGPVAGGTEVRLGVDDLHVPDDRGGVAVDGVSLQVRSGEILGIAGVEGNGQRELGEALSGLRPPSGGRIVAGGTDVTQGGPAVHRRAGMAVITEDRLTWDIIPDLSLAENLVLPAIAAGGYARRGFLNRSAILRDASALLKDFGVEPAQPSISASALSGGNQQKLVLAREIGQSPKVFVVAQPTRGLDVAAANFVHGQLSKLRADGCAVLLISHDLDELMLLADRVLVLYRGKAVYSDAVDRVSTDVIARAMAGLASGRTPQPQEQ
jgi:ABC-type uncharacterized transport system ATPase subunit